jgi:hypothetical protein
MINLLNTFFDYLIDRQTLKHCVFSLLNLLVYHIDRGDLELKLHYTSNESFHSLNLILFRLCCFVVVVVVVVGKLFCLNYDDHFDRLKQNPSHQCLKH